MTTMQSALVSSIQFKLILAIIIGLLLAELLLLGLLLLSVERYSSYWNEIARKPRTQQEITYIALGDSAAQGIGASSPMRGYVGLVAKDIQQRSGRSVHIINLSKSGAGIEHVMNTQLPELEKINPGQDVFITLAIGANDLPMHDADWFEERLDILLPQLPSQTVIADLPYFGSGIKRNLEPKVLEFNEAFYKALSKYQLKIAKLHDVTESQDHVGVHSFDLFHPSNIGYKNWAQAFINELEVR